MSTSFHIGTIASDNYGFPFHPVLNQAEKELFAYSITHGEYGKAKRAAMPQEFGVSFDECSFKDPAEHMLNFIQLNWPVDVAIKNGPHLNRPFLRVIEALCHKDDIALAGAASMGKTFPMGVWALADWMAVPNFTLTLVGSNEIGATEDRIWGAITELHRKSILQCGILVGYRNSIAYDFSVEQENTEKADKVYKNSIKAIAFKNGEEGRKSVKFIRGRKNRRVRALLDELPEMDMYVLDIRSNLSSNRDLVFAAAGNPSMAMNPHLELCLPKDEPDFDSVSDKVEWETNTGVCLLLRGKDSPNMEVGPDEVPPFPFLLDRRKQEKMLKIAGGNESDVEYIRNADGRFMAGAISLSLITQEQIKSSGCEEVPTYTPGNQIHLMSLDTGFTHGGDRAIGQFGKLCTLQTRKKVLHYIGEKEYRVSIDKDYAQGIAEQVVADCIKLGVKPAQFALDISSDGGVIAKEIIKEWIQYDQNAVNILAISSLGSPTNRPVSQLDTRPAKEVYDRLVTEYWYSLSHAISLRCISNFSHSCETAIELCKRQHTSTGRKLSIETKKEFKKRHRYSPDKADAIVYLLENARRNGLLIVPDGDQVHQVKIDDHKKDFSWLSYAKKMRNPEAVQIGGYETDDWGE